ncbi:MAG: hypothetical protein DMG36_22640 [Acidobacteria bacterium]|nr:MAG: hypothetical protein DMG36_22640 [Acidobacteriota bacterium]
MNTKPEMEIIPRNSGEPRSGFGLAIISNKRCISNGLEANHNPANRGSLASKEGQVKRPGATLRFLLSYGELKADD